MNKGVEMYENSSLSAKEMSTARKIAKKLHQDSRTPEYVTMKDAYEIASLLPKNAIFQLRKGTLFSLSILTIAVLYAFPILVIPLIALLYKFHAFEGKPETFHQAIQRIPKNSLPSRYQYLEKAFGEAGLEKYTKDIQSLELVASKVYQLLELDGDMRFSLLPKILPNESENVVSRETTDRYAEARQTLKYIVESRNAIDMDIMVLVAYPIFSSTREPLNRAFTKALSYAQMVEPQPFEPFDPAHPFFEAVAELDGVWSALHTKSQVQRLADFTIEETQKLNRAQSLLEIAANSGSSVSERQNAYRQALKALNQIITIPENARQQFELRAQLSLEA